MRIGLIDVDGHNFPNIPLMKLSAWHKSIGDSVEWYSPLFSGHMDRVYMSKVFSFTPDYEHFVDADEVIRGGSGYCIETVDGREIYHKERDHTLRKRWNTFTQTTIFTLNYAKIRHTDFLQEVVQEAVISVMLKQKREDVPVKLQICRNFGEDRKI